jgi:hypothetical protein
MEDMRPRIKLMADYECWPLWGGAEFGNLDPNSLPLSDTTVQSLLRWSGKYDATLDRANPIASGFLSDADAATFNEEGWLLWDCLRKELPDFRVVYFDNELNQVVDARPTGGISSSS